MGLFDRVRGLFRRERQAEPQPVRTEQATQAAPEPQETRRRGGLFGRLFGGDRRREEQERRESERLQQERQELERARAELERQRQEFERQRQETERREQERQEAERVRQERERQEQQAVKAWESLGVPPVTGGKGWTIYGCRTPEELRARLEEAAAAGKRVSLKVHDKNGWHSLYNNPGRGEFSVKAGMAVSGGAGISAGELLNRGIPGEARPAEERLIGPGPVWESGGVIPDVGGDLEAVGGVGEDVLEGPEWEEEGEDYGYYEGDDYGEGDGDSDSGYSDVDEGSVSGYQLVVY